MENLAQQALHKLAVHEAQCEERLRRLDEKIDDTRHDLSEIREEVKGVNKLVLAIYPFILASIVITEFLR